MLIYEKNVQLYPFLPAIRQHFHHDEWHFGMIIPDLVSNSIHSFISFLI